jgi:hypothetical protein
MATDDRNWTGLYCKTHASIVDNSASYWIYRHTASDNVLHYKQGKWWVTDKYEKDILRSISTLKSTPTKIRTKWMQFIETSTMGEQWVPITVKLQVGHLAVRPFEKASLFENGHSTETHADGFSWKWIVCTTPNGLKRWKRSPPV